MSTPTAASPVPLFELCHDLRLYADELAALGLLMARPAVAAPAPHLGDVARQAQRVGELHKRVKQEMDSLALCLGGGEMANGGPQ